MGRGPGLEVPLSLWGRRPSSGFLPLFPKPQLHCLPWKLVREEGQSCTTSRPERPLRQGKTAARARPETLGLERADMGLWAPLPEKGPPLRQWGAGSWSPAMAMLLSLGTPWPFRESEKRKGAFCTVFPPDNRGDKSILG